MPMICTIMWEIINDAPKTRQSITVAALLKLYTERDPLDFITMDSLRLLSMKTSCNQFVLVMTGRYSKLVRTFLTSKTTSSHIAFLFINSCIITYTIATHMCTDCRTQFFAILFETLSTIVGTELLKTTMYHLQPNGHAPTFNTIIIGKLWHYEQENQQRLWHS